MRRVLILGLLASGAVLTGCATRADRADMCYRDAMAGRGVSRDNSTPQIMTYDPRTGNETRTNVNAQSGDINISARSRAGSARAQVNESGASAEVREGTTNAAVSVKDDKYSLAAGDIVNDSAVGVRGDLNKGKTVDCEVEGSSSMGERSRGWWPFGGRASSPSGGGSGGNNSGGGN